MVSTRLDGKQLGAQHRDLGQTDPRRVSSGLNCENSRRRLQKGSEVYLLDDPKGARLG
jgi:hypothetical protein